MIKSNNLKINNKNGVVYITFPRITATKKVKHAFTTRIGGVSKGYFGAMNMSLTGGDDKESVIENYRIICNAVGIDPKTLILSHQTHTDNLLTVTNKDIGKGIFCDRDYENIDGLVTNCKNVTLVTQYADCTPLIFCDPVKEVIATSHAGWRGTVQEIGKKTVEKMCNEFDCLPQNIICAIGPSIGKCCYEVDDPVYSPFSKLSSIDIPTVFTHKGGDKYMLDLWEANRQILLSAGILPENIDVTDLCTNCNPDVFHSHRFTGGKRGTIAAIISLI